MTISSIDFPIWFSFGCYGGLACCMFAIATNALYTTLRRRGTTRQLAAVVVLCVICALLLLPAIVWLNLRFTTKQADLPFAEIEVALVYVALWGWLLPLGSTSAYCLFTLPRNATTAFRIPHPKQTVRGGTTIARYQPPRQQPGVPVSCVYGAETPWGWLEYRSGNFLGQRLALKYAIITIGRDEDNDIWLDDEMASRRHAELAWDRGQVYLTDCESLNGTLLNSKRVRGFMPVVSNDLIKIGSHHLAFILAELPQGSSLEESDPLVYHTWRSSQESLTGSIDLLSITAEVNHASPLQLLSSLTGALIIRSGTMEGQSFLLDRPVITVGRGVESDIVIDDVSISHSHVQFSRQADGDYVQDLASRNGTQVNSEPVMKPRLLRLGDMLLIGNIVLEYTSVQTAQTTPLTSIIIPPTPTPLLSPGGRVSLMPLKLPSKQKQQ
jgi:pSer/pThr/pTyr-binding forkhead associated (FHA) protein